MSKTLTRFWTKNNRWTIAVVAVMVICLIATMCLGMVFSNKKVQKYARKTFYIVYADKLNSEILATELCAQVSDRGGAGVIYSVGNTKFVVVNVYFDYLSAKSVCEQIKEIYQSADILEIVAPQLEKSKCLQIESNTELSHFYEFLYSSCQELYNMVLQTDKGELVPNECYKKIMRIKENCEDFCTNLSSATDIGAVMCDSSLVLSQLLRTFFDSAFINNLVAKPIKKLYSNWAFEFVDMCQRLKTYKKLQNISKII